MEGCCIDERSARLFYTAWYLPLVSCRRFLVSIYRLRRGMRSHTSKRKWIVHGSCYFTLLFLFLGTGFPWT